MTKKYFLTLLLFIGVLSGTFGQCPIPATLSASSITQTNATLGWTTDAVEGQWEVLILRRAVIKFSAFEIKLQQTKY